MGHHPRLCHHLVAIEHETRQHPSPENDRPFHHIHRQPLCLGASRRATLSALSRLVRVDSTNVLPTTIGEAVGDDDWDCVRMVMGNAWAYIDHAIVTIRAFIVITDGIGSWTDDVFIHRVVATGTSRAHRSNHCRLIMDARDAGDLSRGDALVYTQRVNGHLDGIIVGLLDAFNHPCSTIIRYFFYRGDAPRQWH